MISRRGFFRAVAGAAAACLVPGVSALCPELARVVVATKERILHDKWIAVVNRMMAQMDAEFWGLLVDPGPVADKLWKGFFGG